MTSSRCRASAGRELIAALLPAAFLVACPGAARAADAPAALSWTKLDEGRTGQRNGSMLVYAPDLGRMLLVGEAQGAPCVQSFDPAARVWSDFAAAAPVREGFQNYYQTAYDPGSRSVYCLSGGAVLHVLSVPGKAWRAMPAAAELAGMSWHALACDPAGRRLVVVGADKQVDNLGWTRTVVYDIPSGKWTRLDVADAAVVKAHREFVAATEAAIDLVGRLRLAWYRDPRGVGTDDEIRALGERCAALRTLPQMEAFAAEVDAVTRLVSARGTLEALHAARALQRRIGEAAGAQYPAPCSRRNSPLVFDGKNRCFVLFGGDHEDHLMNDTWVLDLAKPAWRRVAPDRAPSPRAGHALCWLPKCGRIALYEGYVQTSGTDYGAIPYRPLDPVQLWLFDAAAGRWDLAGSRPLTNKDGAAAPAPFGFFHGYASECFCPPALAADAEDTLVLAGTRTSDLWYWGWKRPCETWTLRIDPAAVDAAGRARLGTAPNTRLQRSVAFRADYGEVPDAPKETGLDALPENRWVRLPDPPRNPCSGCRQRDWGTCVWDPDGDQILHWGGGHCVRSASVVVHYSPVSGRIVEGYDADEPYSANGGGGFDSSLLNRPWVSGHNYNHYAYDPKCRLLVSGRGYLYDPDRMDWLRRAPMALPFRFECMGTVVESSPHGAVAWAQKKGFDEAGLWLFDRDTGWTDLAPRGGLFVPYCDSSGMVYDSKRDRMLLSGVGGGYERKSNGTFLAFDFQTRVLAAVAPDNPDLARTGNAREMAYVTHADWVLIGENVRHGDPKTGKSYTRVYDCGRNRMGLLDAGPVPDGHSVGWMYDAKRKLAYAFTFRGEAWALRIEPRTARLLDRAE